MQQASSPVLQQQLRLHPESLQTLHQSTDGTLYPHHQGLPELQTLHTTDIVYQQSYALTGPPQPQPSSHALPVHFEQRGLPPSGPYPPFPAASYQQHVASPRFMDAPPPPLQEHAQQHYHIAAPEAAQKPIQQLPFSPSVPTALQTTHPLPQHVEQAPLQQQPQPQPQPQTQTQTQTHTQRQEGRDGDDAPFSSHGQFQGLKLIPNPPNLEEWRNKLFHVDDMITLTEEQFQTYFPHIDNIYSHRSTQKHKRKRFVSHYWDCRLKGRPPGTKKSTDPDKKKRKRIARERDLCDVKIKITEFFDRQEYEEQLGHRPPGTENDGPSSIPTQPPMNPGQVVDQNQNPNPQFFGQGPLLPQQPAGGWNMPPNMSGQPELNLQQYMPPPSLPPQKFYTFQRVNGNGGNGKGDGVAGPHKHTLEESDRVKKNSVIRWQMKADKEDKKKSHGGDPSKKTYHKKATGNALTTVKNHSKEDDLKLYGSAFCPFVQRVWISLEHKQIPYQYIEVDPYKKPQSLLDVNPRGLVPALRHGPTWSTHESTVIMEYLEDLQKGPPLLPPDAQSRATSRLWSDHINRNIIPCFYKLLQAQDQSDQVSHATEFRNQIGKLVDAADPTGPFFLGPHISFVDVQIAPWIIRLRRVLGPYRGWPEAEAGSRWKQWVDAIEADKSVRMTTSTDELYLDSYERYAENRPGTSQLADAVNSGRGLP